MVCPGTGERSRPGPHRASEQRSLGRCGNFGDTVFVTTEQPSKAIVSGDAPSEWANERTVIDRPLLSLAAPATDELTRSPDYPAARAAAVAGNVEAAFEHLRSALDDDGHGGFPSSVTTDDDLAALRGDPRWPEFLEDAARHRLSTNGRDLHGLELLREAAFSYDSDLHGETAADIGLEIWQTWLESSGQHHEQTRSALQDFVVLSWNNNEGLDALVGPMGRFWSHSRLARESAPGRRRARRSAAGSSSRTTPSGSWSTTGSMRTGTPIAEGVSPPANRSL